MRHWCCALERNPEPGLKPVKYRDRVTVEREKYFILLFMPCDVAGYITQIFSTSKWVLWFSVPGSWASLATVPGTIPL